MIIHKLGLSFFYNMCYNLLMNTEILYNHGDFGLMF